MVKAIIDVSEETNRILNILKAIHNLKDKSEAINFMAESTGNDLIEEEVRPEYLERLKEIDKEKGIKFKNISELRKLIEG